MVCNEGGRSEKGKTSAETCTEMKLGCLKKKHLASAVGRYTLTKLSLRVMIACCDHRREIIRETSARADAPVGSLK